MNTPVDLIVLGTGSAAQSVAYPCREAGWSVAVIDSRPFGGTCALRGCDPNTTLLDSARAEGLDLVGGDEPEDQVLEQPEQDGAMDRRQARSRP